MASIHQPQLPAARVYGNIKTGPAFTREFEDQAGIPVDASNPLLRTYSPFVIRLVTPAILGSYLASGGVDDPYSRRNLDIVGGDFEIPVERFSNQIFGTFATNVVLENGDIVRQDVDSMTPIEFMDDFIRGGTGGFLDVRGAGTSSERRHQGRDIYIDPGIPLYAPFAGTVRVGEVYQDDEKDGGKNVVIQAPDGGIICKIMHVRNPTVSSGQSVEAGGQIGFSYSSDRPGNRFPGVIPPGDGTVRASSPHMHVEFRYGGSGFGGEADPFSQFDVSRIAFPNGYPPDNPVNLVPDGSTRTVTVDADNSQVSRVGFYAAASNALDNLDNFLSYQEQLRQGLVSSVTDLQIQQLESYVRGDGEIIDPGVEGTASTPAIMDMRVTADIILQIINMIRVPPIQLLINPQDLQMQYTKVQAFQERTRVGYVHQHWGDEQPLMNVTGRIGGFVSGSGLRVGISDPTGDQNAVASGLQYASKHDSASYQQFMSLLAFYQNNGYIFDTIFNTKAHHMIGTVAIDYDGVTHVGHFNSFSYEYSSENQNGGLEFSFEFKVSRSFNHSTCDVDIQPYFDPNGFLDTTSGTAPPGEGRLNQPRTNTLQGLANFFVPESDPFFEPPENADTGGVTGESGFAPPPDPEPAPVPEEGDPIPTTSFRQTQHFGVDL